MALIETNFIRPQEVYDRNTGESKVRYRSYDGNDRFIPVLEGENGVPKTMVEVTHTKLKEMRDAGKLTPGALYRITNYNCTTTQENTQSAGHQFDIVLLALSANKLAEEGWAMMNESNIYDVVFNDGTIEKCYVYEYEQGQYNIVRTDNLLGQDVADEGHFDGEEFNVGDYSYNDLTNEGLTYNYFQNSNLSAWKVWYCLDNDTSRFAWADDSMDESTLASIYLHNRKGWDDTFIRDESNDITVNNISYYAWYNSNRDARYYTDILIPTTDEKVYFYNDDDEPHSMDIVNGFSIVSYTPAHEGTGLPNGRGVIYRLIDEFNNDIKYDFKNIQFVRKLTDGQYDADNGTETWCYTLNLWYNNMCQDASILGNTLPNDEGFVTGVYDNIFGYTTAYDLSIEGVNTFAFALGNNVVLSYEDGGYFGINSNTIGNNFYSNTIGNSFYSNTIENSFCDNTVGNSFFSNTIGNYFNRNKIGNNFHTNIIGNNFFDKTISDNTGDKNYGNNGVELATKS